MSATAIALTVAAKKQIESLVVDLHSLAKSSLLNSLNSRKAKKHMEIVFTKIKDLKRVKTIWQMEQAVDIDTFYHPVKAWVKGKRIQINQTADFGYDGNILIEGTLGQGKSIFLRYLSLMEFILSRRVPVFIEFRKIKVGQKIIDHILEELRTLGFPSSYEIFKMFAREGKLIIMLDAFDEAKEEAREDLINEIETILREHENLRCIVTSRPSYGLEASPLFSVFRICELKGRDYEFVIQKMEPERMVSAAIIKGIQKDSTQLAKLLTTPLMVALLMVRYRIDQSLPQNDVAFYDSLFTLLLQRHDRSKPGYVRPRNSDLGDVALLEFFDTFCFTTRKVNEGSFSQTALVGYSRKALAAMKVDSDPQKVIEDIAKITCLLLKEGDEYKFVHKSVQEYHAACFIKNQAEDFSKKFYERMEELWRIWFQELRFLRLIDEYRFLKFFHLPQFHLLAKGAWNGPDEIRSTILEIVKKDELELSLLNSVERKVVHIGCDDSWLVKLFIYEGCHHAQHIFEISEPHLKSALTSISATRRRIPLKELFEINDARPAIIKYASGITDDLHADYLRACDTIRLYEDRVQLLDM